jgi:tRNA uridine 5-carboxymethylaminomethyl modification enzyme
VLENTQQESAIREVDEIEFDGLADEIWAQVELAAKYAGYLEIQQRQAQQQRKLDDIKLPADIDYAKLKGLSYESIEKLSRIRPATAGQASRIPGVRPTDIALLVGLLNRTSNHVRTE